MRLALLGGSPVISQPGPHYTWPRITAEVEKAVLDQLHRSVSIYDRSGIFLEFEERFRALIGRKYALVTNSGTSALFSIYEGLNLKPGDEVIAPAYTFFATVSPLTYFGANIRQVDALENGNIDPKKIEEQITLKTKAIVLTHMWGLPCDVEEILSVATKHNIEVIEDCSHAHGAKYRDRPIGSLGSAAAWSLQGQKNLTGGEGGILLTDQYDLFERALLIGQYNKRAKQQVVQSSDLFEFCTTGFGLKLRAHPLAIAMANAQLNSFEAWHTTKHRFAKKITEALSNYQFINPPDSGNNSHAWYAYVFRYDEEIAEVPIERFVRALHSEGLLEIDRPNSTGCIASYPLFYRTQSALPRIYERPMLLNPDESHSVAKKFFESAIKLPVWAFEDEEPIVNKYIDGLIKVCDVVSREPKILRNA